MKIQLLPNRKGVTLIELLVGLVISAFVIAGIYRVFIAQTRAYTVQDQVADVQQNTRTAMEMMLRDIRMAGYQNNANPVTLPVTIFPGDTPPTIKDDAIRVEYQRGVNCNTVVYYRDAATKQLMRRVYIDGAANPEDVCLENVESLLFNYDLDTNNDGVVESWGNAAAAVGTSKIIGVIVTLRARPTLNNPDVTNMVAARTLTTRVALRNLSLK